MAENDGLITIIRETEEEYIADFCEAYKDDIHTPDGFVVFCKYLRTTAIHFCRGNKKGAKFQKTRAMRIMWAKYILMNPDERIVLKDISTGNTLFFMTREKTPHVVICKKLNDKWNLISSFAVGGDRAKKYLKGEHPYEYYKKPE